VIPDAIYRVDDLLNGQVSAVSSDDERIKVRTQSAARQMRVNGHIHSFVDVGSRHIERESDLASFKTQKT
jgi:hypothetical protein